MDRRKAIRNTGLFIGAAVAVPSLIVLLDSCNTTDRTAWSPQFFTAEEADCISALVDTILPRTATPGALDVNVDVFLDKLFAQTYDDTGQQQIRKDIAEFNSKCQKTYGDVFAKLGNTDRVTMLKAEERTSGKFSQGIWGKSIGVQETIGFYRSIKAMAIWAYSTSERIGKEVLSYDPIPGAYLGCIPLSDVGNKWSL